MAADASILADQFFKEAYVLPGVVGDGYGLLGPIGDRPEERNTIQAFLESQNKEAFDAYKSLFVKFKELVNTRKRIIAAAGVAPPRSLVAIAPAPAASSLAASPTINSHTKNELDNQYKKQLKELAESISDSTSLKTTIDTSVGAIAARASATASAASAASAASEKIRRIFTEFLKIRVKGSLEKGKFLMDELFNEPYELDTRMAEVGKHPSGNNLQIIRMKDGDDILSKFKEKYAYLKEVYSEGDRKFIDTLLTGLAKEKASYIPDLIYTLAKLVPEFIPFTQAGRLVKDINTYIQSGSPISPGRDGLVNAVRSTAAATGEALRKAQAAMDERDRLHGELEGLRDAVISASAEAKAAAASASEANAASAAAQAKAAYKLLDETNSKYFKAFDNYIQADLDYKAANKRYWDALKNFALPVPEKIEADTIPIGTPVVTAVKILELRSLNVTNVPLLKNEIEKVDKYVKAVAAVEGLRASKDNHNTYVEKRSVVNTLFTEKGFIEFFSKHLPQGFIEKLETEENYKELLRKAIFGEELAGKKEEGKEEDEGEEPEGHEGKEGAKGKKGYTEADNTYKVANLSFFDKLTGKALNKKELAEWWKKRGGKFNIGQTIPEPIVTIFTETFNLKKKSKKTVHFADNFLIEGVKGEAARLDDATSRLASSSGPAPAAAAPAPAEEISAKGFANKGVYDQEDGPPISSIDVKSGTMFEMYYLGWLDKNVPLAPVAAAPAPPAAAPASAPAPPPAAAPAPPAAPAADPAAADPPVPAPPAAAPPAPAPPAAADPAAAAPPVPAPPAAAPAPAPPAAAPASSLSASPSSSPAYTPQQKKAITKMMKSLFSFVFSDIQVRDANKEKRFHDAYRIAYTVLEKHQKIPCKAENPELHKYFKKSLEYRKEIAIRELAAAKMVGQVVTPGMQDHFTQLITGLSGLITFLDNDVEGQPCIVYGDTLTGEDTAEGGDVNSELLLQLLTQYIKQRKNGSRPIGKDGLMAFLKQRNIPLRDINQVYKELESMLTDYANLTKENPELRDLVVLFSQIALHIQQLGDIVLELEKLQHQMDKCADDKEKKRLAELLAARRRELADKEAEVEALNRKYQAERDGFLARIAELEKLISLKNQDIEVMEGKRDNCLEKVARLKGLIAGLEARLAAAKAEAAKVPGLAENLDEANKDLADKKERISGLEAQLAAAQLQAEKVPGLAENLDKANKELDDKEKRISKLEGELAAAQLEAKKVPGLEAQAAKVPGLEATIGGLQAELAGLRAQLAAAIARAEEAEESLRKCGEEYARLKAENEGLIRALRDCERQKAALGASAARRLPPPPPPSVVVPPPAKAPPKLRKSTLKLIADDINELGPICFYVFFKTYLYDGFKGSSITETSYDTNGKIVAKERTLARVYYTKEFINKLYPKIFFKVRHQRLPREKEQDYSEEWKNTVLWFMFHLIRRIGELYLDIKGVPVLNFLVKPAIKINFDSVDKTEIKDYIIILFNELCAFLGIVDAASIRSNLLKKSDNLMISLRSTVRTLYDNLKPSKLTTAELILYGIENTCMRGLLRQLKEEEEEEAARLGGGGGGGGGPRRPQIGGGRRTSVKSLSQGMLLLFLVELRKSKQLKSAKEVQGLVNKAGKALDSIGQYELVLTILQEIVGNINIHTEEGYTYVKLNDLKEEKANALVESYNHVFSKSDSKMFKTLGTAGSFHASAPEEFEEVLGKGPFCLVLVEDKSKEETPLHGVSDEYQVVLEEKERKVLEDNGGIPLGGVIFLYLVCLNELYCDSSDEECIRPTI